MSVTIQTITALFVSRTNEDVVVLKGFCSQTNMKSYRNIHATMRYLAVYAFCIKALFVKK